MIVGEVDDKAQLYFEIGLIGADGDIICVNALLDTGFTGWLAIDKQDAESLDWSFTENTFAMITANGTTDFNVYAGKVIFDGQEVNIYALGGEEIHEIIIGVQWLKTNRLVVDLPAGVLTLG